MNKISRRSFVGLGSSLMAAGLTLPAACTVTGGQRKDETGLPPMIHAADLYHYHCDPDDHWDLASIYAIQGDRSKAMEWLRTAFNEGFLNRRQSRIDFNLENLWYDPDFILLTSGN